jgi:hypothetical protein
MTSVGGAVSFNCATGELARELETQLSADFKNPVI